MGPAERNISEHLEWNLGNRKKKKNYQNKYEINLKKLLLTTAASIKGSINTNSSLDKKENKLVEQFLTWNNQLCIAIFYTADKFCEFLWQRYISVNFFVFIWWPLLPQSCWSWKRFSSREQIEEVKVVLIKYF